MFFLEHQASQETRKTAKKPPKTAPDSLQAKRLSKTAQFRIQTLEKKSKMAPKVVPKSSRRWSKKIIPKTNPKMGPFFGIVLGTVLAPKRVPKLLQN